MEHASAESRTALQEPQKLSAAAWVAIWVGIAVLAALSSAIVAAAGRTPDLFLTTCLLLCVVAAAFDAGTGHIPNALTYTAILSGLAINTLATVSPLELRGAAGMGSALTGMLAYGGVGLVCMLAAGMGGGDAKLLAAIGAILGFRLATIALVFTLAAAVAYALVNLAVRGALNAALRSIALDFLNLVLLGIKPDVREARVSARSIPLAVPLLIGIPLSRLEPARQLWVWMGGWA